MNLEQIYEQLLLENIAEDIAKKILIFRKDSNPDETFNKLKEIVEPYQDNQFARNYAHLPMLAAFYSRDKININVLRDYYKKYIDNKQLSSSGAINKYGERGTKLTFKDFEQEVDAAFQVLTHIKNKEFTSNENEDIVYEDNNITIYLGNSKAKCIKYGQGTKYGLCISTKSSGNYYYKYRIDDKLTTYFVYFKDKTINPPANFIIIDRNPDGSYAYNKINKNTDYDISKNEILKEFPVLEPAFEKDVFKSIPLSKEELEIQKLDEKKSILDLNDLKDKLLYIELGHEIEINEWNMLSNIELPYILPYYINICDNDIPKKLLDKYPQFKDRYIKRIKERFEDKWDTNKKMAEDLTLDELEYAKSIGLNIKRIKNIFVLESSKKWKGQLIIQQEAISKIKNGDNINLSELWLYELPDLTEYNCGDFICYNNNLTSLEGAPQKVGRDFYCYNNNLTSLEGAPQKVGGDFYCSHNNLTNLKGAPQEVSGDFYCSNKNLTSLEGAPQKVGGDFYCSNNKNLTSLEGAPQKVGGSFICSNNKNLTSLEGAPQEVGEYFSCDNNNLTSLEGAPQKVGGEFYCSNNNLTSLEGAPQEVGGYFNCSNNNLTSLEGAPQEVGGNFNCSNNNLTNLKGAPQEVSGDFYCSNNNLTSLEGAPQKVGRLFYSNSDQFSDKDYRKYVKTHYGIKESFRFKFDEKVRYYL